MRTTNAIARQAGVLYFLFMLIAIFGEFLFPAFVVPGDAAATARNITSGELTYRLGILTGLATHLIFIVLVANLYTLFKDVSRTYALLMVLFVSVGVAFALANLLNKMAPLLLLSGADFLSAFTRPQLEAMALGALRLHSLGAAIAMAFWGLWLFPFGILVIKSGFFPRVLGVLLLVAGFAYLASSVTGIAWPAYRRVVSQAMMPLYLGEVPIIFWMLLAGTSRGASRRSTTAA